LPLSLTSRWHTGGITITSPKIEAPQIEDPEVDAAEKEFQTPLYNVVLIDDNDHTYDYVIEMLQKIFIFTAEQALRHAKEVDSRGRTVLLTCELPEAEFARDQIHGYGPDWRLDRSKGSMSAVVEPAAGAVN
jgi:ATP-dependent Clp protease adaptor protein ClpS